MIFCFSLPPFFELKQDWWWFQQTPLFSASLCSYELWNLEKSPFSTKLLHNSLSYYRIQHTCNFLQDLHIPQITLSYILLVSAPIFACTFWCISNLLWIVSSFMAELCIILVCNSHLWIYLFIQRKERGERGRKGGRIWMGFSFENHFSNQ